MIRELEDKNVLKHLKVREEKIATQITHMQAKQVLEREALIKRIEAASGE